MGHRAALPADLCFIEGDLRDAGRLSAAVKDARADVVIHLAALALVGESMQHPERYFDVNVTGGLNLLQAMLEHGPRRLVFSSSCAVYGVPAELPIRETMPREPVNAYGASKHMFEQMVDWFDQRHGFQSTVFRYFNAAGCWGGLGEDHTPETHLIPNVLRAAAGRLPALDVYGTDYPTPDGTCLRDFIHVRDVARAHLLASQTGVTGRFNLGTGQPVSVRQVIETAAAVCGRQIPVRYGPRREGDPAVLYASAGLAEQTLGWQPRHSHLRDMIEQAWNWMERHPQGYRQACAA
jgi:UDP-glucose 4-epimerase